MRTLRFLPFIVLLATPLFLGGCECMLEAMLDDGDSCHHHHHAAAYHHETHCHPRPGCHRK